MCEGHIKTEFALPKNDAILPLKCYDELCVMNRWSFGQWRKCQSNIQQCCGDLNFHLIIHTHTVRCVLISEEFIFICREHNCLANQLSLYDSIRSLKTRLVMNNTSTHTRLMVRGHGHSTLFKHRYICVWIWLFNWIMQCEVKLNSLCKCFWSLYFKW